MKNIKYSFVLFVVLLVSGCVSSGKLPPSNVNQPDSLPSWYLNPNASNAMYYYGVGEGENKNEAKINALAQIAAQISVSVSSSLDMVQTSQESAEESSYDKTVQIRTNASIDKIKFTGAKVIKNAFINGIFYAYLEVDRDLLFKALKKAMDVNFNKTTSLWTHIQENGVFDFLKNSTTIESQITNVLTQLPILKAINGNFDESNYSASLSKIAGDAMELKSSAVVFVTKDNASKYESVVKKHLSSYGLNLVSDLDSVKVKKNLLIVTVTKEEKPKKVKSTDPRLKGASFAEVAITLVTMNSDRKIVAQNIITVVNVSKEGYKVATDKTAKFEREITKKGIINILLEKK